MSYLTDNLLYEHMKLFEIREKDIYMRGSDCEVYNIDGSISFLSDAIIWVDENGHYVKPKEVKPKKCRWCCWK
jgi:hypothetical protein